MEHTRDEDCQTVCDIDPYDDDTCAVCGVLHAAPCAWCDRRAFHEDGCPVITFCACGHDAVSHKGYGEPPFGACESAGCPCEDFKD